MSRLACFLDAGRSIEEGADRAALAESLGYESVWATHTVTREPLQTLAAYAAKTERIGLGTGVIPLVSRHPIVAAMEAATLDEASGGRLTLGMGISHRSLVEDWYGETFDKPLARMREYSTIVRTLLDQGAVHFEGEHYSARFTFIGYKPRVGMKLFFAALAPGMLRLAAELADGIVLWMCSPKYIRETIRPTIDEVLTKKGRDPAHFDIVAAVPSSLSENLDGARDAFRRAAQPYPYLPFYRRVIEEGGHADAIAAAEAGEPLPASFVEAMAGLGDADTIRAKIEEYREAGVTLPAVGPVPRHEGGAGSEETLKAAIG
ncbi:MAG: LLM class flavin-dependent oxidoreductase [Actinomycetota bacterium]